MLPNVQFQETQFVFRLEFAVTSGAPNTKNALAKMVRKKIPWKAARIVSVASFYIADINPITSYISYYINTYVRKFRLFKICYVSDALYKIDTFSS